MAAVYLQFQCVCNGKSLRRQKHLLTSTVSGFHIGTGDLIHLETLRAWHAASTTSASTPPQPLTSSEAK
jgi:hypothetical protein